MRLLLGLLLLGASTLLNVNIEPQIKELTKVPLPKPAFARIVSGEFTPLASDYYLIQAAVFYGEGKAFDEGDAEWLSQALKLSSSLDRKYREPYWMAGSVLPWEDKVEPALEILEEGLKHRPKGWKIPFHIGFIHYYFKRNNDAAADYFAQASQLEGSPQYLPLLASRLMSKQERQVGVAIALIKQQLKSAQSDMMRTKLTKRLTALQRIQFLQQNIQAFEKQHGEPPESLQSLIDAGLLDQIPEDPYGGTFHITKKGKVWSTSELR